MSTTPSKGALIWMGSKFLVPPPDYWQYLAKAAEEPQRRQIQKLQSFSDARTNEFTADALGRPEDTAIGLLDRVARHGWIERLQRWKCPNCRLDLAPEQAGQDVCPDCGEAYQEHGGVTLETVYARDLAPTRSVAWVAAIHGMATSGTWQEEFNWQIGTTWGRSVPVAVYKYGIIVAGVLMTWRRNTLRDDLRKKLAAFREQADAKGYRGKPDLIVHSFGTWLVGHLLEEELAQEPAERLEFGRIILTGCVLRPDFKWNEIKGAGIVEEVLNHCGTKDWIVPLAHPTIWDSGPSGRRGFDGGEVINVRYREYGHSDLFWVDKYVVDGKPFQKNGGASGVSHLQYAYRRHWRPFLTLPGSELHRLQDRFVPARDWRPLPWPLRGTVFPFVALPLALALLLLLVAGLGKALQMVWTVAATVVGITAAGLLALLLGIGLTALWRLLRG